MLPDLDASWLTGPDAPRLARGVRRWSLPPLVAGLVALVLLPPAAPLLFAVGAFVVWFFRDPDRDPPESGIVSPADGTVSVIREEDGRLRVGVFLSPLDVHVARAPVGGRVDDLTHHPGGHWPAFTKESEHNERVTFAVESESETTRDDAPRVEGALIAGWFARRITPYVASGAAVDRGDRIGHVAFGSRADVVLPARYDRVNLRVERGDAVRAGETKLVE
jgi:phosphatidylserine decarboxylase